MPRQVSFAQEPAEEGPPGRSGGQMAVADAGAAVVGDPVDWAGGGVGEDFFESFEDREADFAFVGGGGAGAYAVAWEFWDEERGMWLPSVQDLDWW